MKLYCGTYKKYNEGSLFGEWLDLDEYSDAEDFLKACAELHKDEPDPEFMFQDYEADYGWEESFYNESSVLQEYWDIKEALAKESVDDKLFDAWLSGSNELPSVEGVKKCQEMDCGIYGSEKDFAMQDAIETGAIDPKSYLIDYIDWERIWNDTYNMEGYWFEGGHVFDSNRG